MAAGNTWRQRFYDEPKENSVKNAFKGKVHLLSVALDYKPVGNYKVDCGELGCIPDCERLTKIAQQRGVKDIVKIYDDGSTDRHPCIADVTEALREIGARCEPDDFFVFQYSGHGSNQPNENEASGFDSLLCLTSKDGTSEDWLDDDISKVILDAFPPEVHILMICDACHSAGCLDLTKKFKGRSVYALSGCQDTQCSCDTGDGGLMTLALLKVLQSKQTKQLRQKRKASLQYIFNRMVEIMDDEEEDDDDDFDEDYRYEDDDEDDDGVDPVTGEEPEPGQNINLMWIGRDPIARAFPF